MQQHNKYMRNNFSVLFENDFTTIGNVFEDAYCYHKLTKKDFFIFSFDNDPTCAIAGKIMIGV